MKSVLIVFGVVFLICVGISIAALVEKRDDA
jgi:hypothetical protein